MIEDLKRIRIEEIDESIANLEKMMPVKKQYNWLERTITKKKEFIRSIDDYYIKKEEIEQKRQELESKKEKYLEAKVPAELDLTFENAIKLLKDKGIDPILTETDLTDFNIITKPNVDNLDGLILVHKSGHVPTDSRVHSLKELGIKGTVNYKVGGKEIETTFDKGRNTVHFAVNGEVGSHMYGNWDDKKYAVLIPFKDIPKQEIGSAAPQDTFIVGGVNLTPNSWILVPKGEKEEVQKNNPQVNVLEYEGKNVSGYADQLIKNLGYKQMSIGPNGWDQDRKSEKKYKDLMEKEGLSTTSHSSTIYSLQENMDNCMDALLGILYYAYENIELLNDEKFKKELQNTIENLSYSLFLNDCYIITDKSTLTSMICEKFKNTPFEIDKNSLDNYPNISDIRSNLPYILMNKLLEYYQKAINTEEQKPSIKR